MVGLCVCVLITVRRDALCGRTISFAIYLFLTGHMKWGIGATQQQKWNAIRIHEMSKRLPFTSTESGTRQVINALGKKTCINIAKCSQHCILGISVCTQ